ncbi:MAG: sulfite exporter TauE/SafE family protein [Deltaproteobacteria bacterium]|nr:sulfite exporter TauE/SafE family protein [Deltaproteobacteria bacterium]
MEFLEITFQTAGISTYAFLPPLVALMISFFTSMAGVSGAFLLLPFQISILGFATPSVSATNLLYNVVGTPGGVASYFKRKRILWPLIACILSGSVPGVLIGYYFRVTLLPDPKTFKLFIGIVLLYVGWRLFLDLRHHRTKKLKNKNSGFHIRQISFKLKIVHFKFGNKDVYFNAAIVLGFSLIVGIISGIYGIGGGAIISPFLVTILGLPIYAVAGAVLAANFTTSLAGMIFYSTIPLHHGNASPPDFLLGFLFGVGGLFGMYFGAKVQHRVPEATIKMILLAIVVTVSVKYIFQFF